MNPKLLNILKICIAIFLVYFLYSKGLLNIDIFTILKSPSAVFICLILVLLNIIFTAFRWYCLLRAQSIEIAFRHCYKLSFIGVFFNFAMPGGVGGDVVKMYYLLKHKENLSKTYLASSIFYDRIIGVFSLALFSAVVAILNLDIFLKSVFFAPLALFISALLLLLLLLALVFCSEPRAKRILKSKTFLKLPKHQSFHNLLIVPSIYWKHKKHLFLAMLCSFAATISVISIFYICSVEFLNSDLYSFADFGFAVPLALLASAVPIAPAGIGVAQAAVSFFLSMMHTETTAVGSNIMTIYQFFLLVWGFVGLYFYLRIGKIDASRK